MPVNQGTNYDRVMRAGVFFSLLGALVMLSGCELAPSFFERETLTVEEFRVEPETIHRGQLATIHWSVRGATQVEVMPELGIVGRAGSMQLLPSGTTTYQLRATGANGEIVRSAMLIVRAEDEMPGPFRQRRAKPIPVVWRGGPADSID